MRPLLPWPTLAALTVSFRLARVAQPRTEAEGAEEDLAAFIRSALPEGR